MQKEQFRKHHTGFETSQQGTQQHTEYKANSIHFSCADLYLILVWPGRSRLEYCLDRALKSPPSPLPLPPLAGSNVGLAAVVIFDGSAVATHERRKNTSWKSSNVQNSTHQGLRTIIQGGKARNSSWHKYLNLLVNTETVAYFKYNYPTCFNPTVIMETLKNCVQENKSS